MPHWLGEEHYPPRGTGDAGFGVRDMFRADFADEKKLRSRGGLLARVFLERNSLSSSVEPLAKSVSHSEDRGERYGGALLA